MSRSAVSSPPSRREARREREIEHRRADVLEAATEAFAAHGYHDAQIGEIAARAEISLASLYAMFDGKEAIYREVMREAALRLRDDVESRLVERDGAEERLGLVIDAFFDYFERNRSLLRIVLAGSRGMPWQVRDRAGESANRILDDFYRRLLDLCRELIDRRGLTGVDPEALGAAVVGTVTHFAVWLLEEHPDRRLTQGAPAVRALFTRMIGTGGSP
jgi:TetR/AcrR family transcriptional regulator